MRILLVLLLSSVSFGATVLRIACGGPGGVDLTGNVWAADRAFSGGGPWTAVNQPALAALAVPYQTLRYSNPPGAPFSYIFQLAPGSYKVTLKFLEPNKTAAGQRLFSVSINGAAAVSGLDLFAAAGSLKPYDLIFTVSAPTGQIQINLTASLGNAVLSAIQIDDVPAPPTPTVLSYVCEQGIGAAYTTPDGLNTSGNLFTGIYSVFGCENFTGLPLHVARARCRSDVPGNSLDIKVPDATGAFQSILTAPVPCTPESTEGAVLPGMSYPDGGVLTFVISIMAAPPTGTAKQVLGSVVLEQNRTASQLGRLQSCAGSGPGWDCGGLWAASITLPDGSALPLVGAAMPVPSPAPGVVWTDK